MYTSKQRPYFSFCATKTFLYTGSRCINTAYVCNETRSLSLPTPTHGARLLKYCSISFYANERTTSRLRIRQQYLSCFEARTRRPLAVENTPGVCHDGSLARPDTTQKLCPPSTDCKPRPREHNPRTPFFAIAPPKLTNRTIHGKTKKTAPDAASQTLQNMMFAPCSNEDAAQFEYPPITSTAANRRLLSYIN